jgi:hypothetical protein
MKAYWIVAFEFTPAPRIAIAYLGVDFEKSLDRGRKAPGE